MKKIRNTEKSKLLKAVSFVRIYQPKHKLMKKVILKVSGIPCDDLNLTSIVWKKLLLQLSLYFSVQIETENYKFINESQFKYFVRCGKTCITFDTFYGEPLSFNSKRLQKFLVTFAFSVFDWRVVKNRAHECWLRFCFLK